jgi:ABC-2 type transport system permease protein
MPNPVYAIVVKDLKLLVRDPGGLLMLFVLPALFIAVLSVSLRGAFASAEDDDKLAILLVDEDRGDAGKLYRDGLAAAGHFDVVRAVDGADLDAARAEALVAGGRYRVAVVIPYRADEALALRRAARVRMIVDPALSEEFALAVENTLENLSYVGTIGGLLRQTRATGEGEEPRARLERDGLSVSLETASRTRADVLPNSVQQNVPGWTIFAMFWIAQILALSIINERTSGAFTRLLVAPISLVHYAVGKLIPYLAVNLVQAALMFAIGVYALPLFGCPRLEISNLPGLALLTFCVSLVALGFGFLMASLSRTSLLAASVSASALVIMSVVGGIMVPKLVMPEAMQTASWFVPQGWALEGYLDLLVRGRGVRDILPHAGVLLGFAALAFAVSAVRMSQIRREG